QEEDGIRDRTVTGVQTCALPISGKVVGCLEVHAVDLGHDRQGNPPLFLPIAYHRAQEQRCVFPFEVFWQFVVIAQLQAERPVLRSEERRVGKEDSSQRWPGGG